MIEEEIKSPSWKSPTKIKPLNPTKEYPSHQKRLEKSPPWKDFWEHKFAIDKPQKAAPKWEITLYTQAELEFIERKEKVLNEHYMEWDGPIIWKKGYNLFTYGEWEFQIVYDSSEKLPSNFIPPEPILVKDLQRNKVYEIEKFLNTFKQTEIERALRRNLENIKEYTTNIAIDEEDLASIGDEFGLTDDERSILY